MTTDGATNLDVAIVQACDANYFPFALFLARQILFHNPDRSYDIVIASSDDLSLPDWARAAGIKFFRISPDKRLENLRSLRGSMASCLRLLLPRQLGDAYRRLLYLDSDIFFEGGDLGRLLRIDLGDHCLAAAHDAPMLLDPKFHAKDYQLIGHPVTPYFNSGVMVIDTADFIANKVLERGLAIADKFPDRLMYCDQSMLNTALVGDFSELAPCWNWQANGKLVLVPYTYPPRFRHFIGPTKPWNDPTGWFDARYRHAYAEFFRTHMPEALARLAPAAASAPMNIARLGQIAGAHLKARKQVQAAIARFRDEWDVKL